MKVGERKDDIILTIIFIITFIVHLPILDNFFLIDDTNWILRSIEFSQNPTSILKILEDGRPRPFVIVYFFFLYKIFGLNPVFYYLGNILWHILNCIILYYFILYFLSLFSISSRIITFLSVLFFSLLYAHYQPIIWIGAIPHTMSGSFFLLSLFSYLAYLKENKKIFNIISGIFFLVGILTRESVIFLPVFTLYVGFVYIRQKKIKISQLFSSNVIFLISIVVFFLIQKISTGKFYDYKVGGYEIDLHFIKTIFSSISQIFLNTIGIVKIPSYFAVFPKQLIYLNLFLFFGAVVIILRFIFYSKISKFILHIFLFSLLWMVFTIVVFSFFKSIEEFGTFNRNRFFYLPSIGFCLFVGTLFGVLISDLLDRKKYIKLIFIFTFILNTLITNVGYILQAEKYFDYWGEIRKGFLFQAKNLCKYENKECNIYLLNFPTSPFLAIGNRDHLQQLINLYHSKKWKLLWLDVPSYDKLKEILPKNNIPFYILIYDNGRIVEVKPQ